jgi:hypothetical protein
MPLEPPEKKETGVRRQKSGDKKSKEESQKQSREKSTVEKRK